MSRTSCAFIAGASLACVMVVFGFAVGYRSLLLRPRPTAPIAQARVCSDCATKPNYPTCRDRGCKKCPEECCGPDNDKCCCLHADTCSCEHNPATIEGTDAAR